MERLWYITATITAIMDTVSTISMSSTKLASTSCLIQTLVKIICTNIKPVKWSNDRRRLCFVISCKKAVSTSTCKFALTKVKMPSDSGAYTGVKKTRSTL